MTLIERDPTQGTTTALPQEVLPTQQSEPPLEVPTGTADSDGEKIADVTE